jgi:hypothetical protein
MMIVEMVRRLFSVSFRFLEAKTNYRKSREAIERDKRRTGLWWGLEGNGIGA